MRISPDDEATPAGKWVRFGNKFESCTCVGREYDGIVRRRIEM